MNERYEFPIPYGWYQIAFSSELDVCQSKPLRYFGQDMVMYRGEDGQVRVLDAYCPHQGAHLGYGLHDAEGGGKVVGNDIICPFHAWQFNGDGEVVKIPYAKNIPPKVAGKQCIPSWHCAERNQVIWAWYHPDRNQAPLWEVQPVPEADDPKSGWSKLTRSKGKHWTIKTVAQEVAENAVDYAHFIYVHGVKSDPTADLTYDGPFATRVVNADMETPRGVVKGSIASISWGPGQNWTRFTGIAETLLFGNLTPIDEEHVEINFSFLQPLVNGEEPHGGVHDAIVADICRQLDEDKIIWERKIYRNAPVLCDSDGPISQFRRYYSQFYSH